MTLRVLTWNLYHGRADPPAGRPLFDEFAAMLAGWSWDVALLQEVPPWWPPQLARATDAAERHVHAVGVRTGDDSIVEELAAHASIPVFNMLTARHHPCQALADLLTLRETFGTLEGVRLAYVGDGNNVARSLAVLGAIAGVDVVVAAPDGYQLEPEAGATLTDDPVAAVQGANAVYADVWVSMGDEATADERRAALAPYRLDDALLDRAAPDAIALHCLPAHPGEEITAEVLYGPRSAVWQQAANRLPTEQAVLHALVTGWEG